VVSSPGPLYISCIVSAEFESAVSALFGQMSTVTRAGVELEQVTPDWEPEVTRFEYDRDTTPPSLAVVAAVSAATGIDPEEIEPLGAVVDADALDALGRPRSAMVGSSVQVTLSLERRTVSVDTHGAVTVTSDERVGVGSEGVNAG